MGRINRKKIPDRGQGLIESGCINDSVLYGLTYHFGPPGTVESPDDNAFNLDHFEQGSKDIISR